MTTPTERPHGSGRRWMGDLLPCPFCGGMAGVVEQKTGKLAGEWIVDCLGREDDKGNPCSASVFGSSRDEAIAQWNRRAPRFSPEEREALEALAANAKYGRPGCYHEDFVLQRHAATIRKMLEEK